MAQIRVTFAFSIFLLTIVTEVSGQPLPITIREIKVKRQQQLVGDRSLQNKRFFVEGYFFKDPLPSLLTKPEWEYVNSRIPDSAFIVLEPTYFRDDARKYQGAYLKIEGTVNTKEDTIRGHEFARGKEIRYDVDFIPSAPPVILVPGRGIENPRPLSITQPFTMKQPLVEGVNKNYAMLYSGGIDYGRAKVRFFNDIHFMYKVLQTRYGYQKDHILVVYKDGEPDTAGLPVDYPANSDGLEKAFSELARRMHGEDLFFYMTNHGDGYDEKDKEKRIGLPDEDPQDEINPYHYDEISYYYHEPDPAIRDDYFAERINRLQVGKLIGVFQQCYSGGFLYDLRGANRVLVSASTEFSSSYSNQAATYDEFSYYFISALFGATPDGKPVDADDDHNRKVSILEAFQYARKMDTQKEKAQLEDTGDGKQTEDPIGQPGKDGWLASMSYL